MVWDIAARIQGDRELARIANLQQEGKVLPGSPREPGMSFAYVPRVLRAAGAGTVVLMHGSRPRA